MSPNRSFHWPRDYSRSEEVSLRRQSTLSTLDTFRATKVPIEHRCFKTLMSAAKFGMALALDRDAMFRINCEAVMWKITSRGFTLEELLIIAAMNLLGSAAIFSFDIFDAVVSYLRSTLKIHGITSFAE